MAEPVPVFADPAWRRTFRRRLRAWYERHARDLPWRRTRDPYAIWVSEVMLQQTQVATVAGYFERFMAAWPSIADLAAAEEAEVLRLWEGLGYYRRARQLHQAARIIVQEHGGQFPRDPEVVGRLPGIGRYTAGAVLAIAFDARQPILEANTRRLFSRLLAYRGDPASAAGTGLLWAMAEAILPRRRVGAFNQALMELGSQVCVSRSPRCPDCPVEPLCRARAAGFEEKIPRRGPKTRYVARREVAVIVRRGGRVLLVRCPEGGRWAGLWDFPRFAVQATQPAALRQEIRDKLAQQTGLAVRLDRHLTTIRHGVTRLRITLDGYLASYRAGPNGRPAASETQWVTPRELDDYPLSRTGRQLSRLLGGESTGT